MKSFWFGGVVGASLGSAAAILLVVLDVRSAEVRADPWSVVGIFVGLLAAIALALIGGLAGVAFQAVRSGARDFAENMFGICSGYVPPAPGESSECGKDQQMSPRGKCKTKPLTTWLADEIDTLAGRDPAGDPLTFGDLCARDVRLRMFTTNLTDGTPYTMPFKKVFYFHEDEMRGLFPRRVVDWMVAHAREVEPDTRAILDAASPKLRALPLRDALPVILATRMSLSFPMLLTAVPLWQIDRGAGKAYRCWFSDGGITSNFPIHFFDAALPRRPTFGLNLGPFLEGDAPGSDVYWAKTNNESLAPRWSGVDTVGRFGRAILDTMQNWSDNAQTLLPGYRDRIVVIKHSEDEGGMNLDMPRERIIAFAERGRRAGAGLVAKFAKPEPPEGDKLGWDNHRWARYRSAMSSLELFVESWLRGFIEDGDPSDLSYPDLMERPPSYVWPGVQRERGAKITTLFHELASEWLEPAQSELLSDIGCGLDRESSIYEDAHPFRVGAPHPRPRLRLTPDF